MSRFKLSKLERREDAYTKVAHVPVGLEVYGNNDELEIPEVGLPFYFTAGRLSECIRTSIVKEIIDQSEDFVLFKTMNSIYKLEKVKEDQ